MTRMTRRAVLGASAALAAPLPLRAQPRAIRWGELLPANHPQVQMVERIAREVREKTAGRLEIQSFPGGQLGSGRDMMEAVSTGALQFTTDGAGALAAFLPPLSVIEAPYLWRDAAHMAKVAATPIFARLNEQLVARRGMRMIGITYYGKRHLTSSAAKPVRAVGDMAGFRLRVPPVDVFRAMVEAWGGRPTPIAFPELYLALAQGAVDGQENPLPTIHSAKLFEVQKHLVLTGHIITPRMPIVNEAFWRSLASPDRDALEAAIASAAQWQDAELARQESELVATLKAAGMEVIEVDVASFRAPVLAKVPAQFADRWGPGTFDTLAAL
ncbi:MAG: sialic acid TRAP transporter substrate-binding protein SiaP [Elioraea tepidiphila]